MFENRFLNIIAKLYGYLIKIGSNLQSLFLLYMRLTWGHQFFMTGLGKLANIEKIAQYFQTLHIAAPHFNAYLVASIETVCGFLLFFGFASRLVSIPLIITMLVALSTAHAPNISEWRFLFEPASLVSQTPYPFLLTALLVFIFGPGRVSIDGIIKHWVDRQPKY